MKRGIRGAAAALPIVLCVAAAACDDVERFSTEPGKAYCGAITLGSSFRMGLSPRVQMRLRFDAALIDGPESPGTLSTYEAGAGDQPERRLFDEAELRPMPAMAHDPLSRLTFGDGRERNAIYAVSPGDPEAESMLAIVSLRADEQVEVRLVRAGSKAADDGALPPEGRRAIFGIFTLSRQKGGCGF
jgi:hypothetical protein